jgi:hypothetical protein
MKYLVSAYKIPDKLWHNFFRVGEKPIRINNVGYWADDTTHEYKIEKVLVGNDILIQEIDGYIKWAFSSNHYFNYAIYKPNNENYRLIEFDSDEAALLWFKLEYGG